MRRITLYAGTAFLAFVCGVLANSLVQKYFRSQSLIVYSNAGHSGLEMMPRFISEGSLLEPDYHIYWYRTPSSDDPQEITLFADFRSAQVTHGLFESNATSDASKLVEIGSKLDGNGGKIGRRGIIKFKDVQAVRIFWTDRDNFWSRLSACCFFKINGASHETIHCDQLLLGAQCRNRIHGGGAARRKETRE